MEDRGRLDSGFYDVFGDYGSIRYLIPRIKMEIMDIDLAMKDLVVEEAIGNFLG